MEEIRRRVFDRISNLIDSAPVDGISAEGEYSESVRDIQLAYVAGLPSARLAANNVLLEISKQPRS